MQDNKEVVFVLITGLNPESWTLPTKGVMTKDASGQLKHIGYFPGQESVFVEEVYKTNKELKPTKVPSFSLNLMNGKTELRVNSANKALVDYLKIHPWFGKKYTITSTEIESEKALAGYELKEKALELAKCETDLEIRSKAMVVFGIEALHWQVKVAESKLKGLAFEKPETVIKKLSAIDYETQYIAAQSYVQGIVKNNSGQTKVVWADTEQTILNLAVGEIANIKLGEFLHSKENGALETLQTIYEKLGGNSPKKANSEKLAQLDELAKAKISDQEAEIARLKQELEESKKNSVKELGVDDVVLGSGGGGEMTLEEAQEAYQRKIGDLPPRFKNDLEWILSKLR